ncbi:NAD(P)-binding domain-containing protein [Defluviimonas sp. WL0024]|uniref:NAD(P)-binding domain-containing protein n=1 Tax=Albidovulum salinarum TaxID=2984153 RepID=A0ABT2X7H6_9RHOB|nr:NAD(P)-binding domain-containing protein [Defluviimonas sp. WL0024]MCU9849901.1 NAD(P)-binding domain-containing protein [Defluviimonas sp. WL0024]
MFDRSANPVGPHCGTERSFDQPAFGAAFRNSCTQEWMIWSLAIWGRYEIRGGALECIVVGGGWAGLAVSGELTARGIQHRLFERHRIAETWRTQRWDSFRINTPRHQTVMPGERDTSGDPDGAMPVAEFIALMQDYAGRRGLPVECGREVRRIEPHGRGYRIELDRETVLSRCVVVASGDQNVAVRPALAANVPDAVAQYDATSYRNPTSMPEGAVLVVGSGQSGGQIAEDLIRAGREVYLSTSRVARQTHSYRGRHSMAWMVDTGIMDIPKANLLAAGPIPTRALVGADHTISLQSLSAQGVQLLGRLTAIDAGRAHFDSDVSVNVAFGDTTAAETKARIDAWLTANGIMAPAARTDPAETVVPTLPDPAILELDLTQSVGSVVWCTGVRGDYTFLRVPAVLDNRGAPIESGGLTRVAGLCIAGVPYSVSRRSGTILAAAPDAERMVNHVEMVLRSN